MIKSIFYLLIISFLFISCNQNVSEIKKEENKEIITPDKLKTAISEIDDSLKNMLTNAINQDDFQMNNAVYFEAINRNKEFFFHFPEDAYSETALHKIAAIFLQLNLEDDAVKWRDTLLHRFPNSTYKLGVLELQMSYFGSDENFNQQKVEYFGNEILKLTNLSSEKREEIEFRLKHSDKSFSQLIDIQVQKLLAQ